MGAMRLAVPSFHAQIYSAPQPLWSRDLLSNKTMATMEGVFIFIGRAISIFYVSMPEVFMCFLCAPVLRMAGAVAGL